MKIYPKSFGLRFKVLIVIFAGLFVLAFWWTNPELKSPGTVKIWDRNGILLYESAGGIGRKIPVSYDNLPDTLKNAVIASEDNTFWTNSGIDIPAMARSALLDIKAKKIVSGASTITQQLARALVISDRSSSSRSVVRKIREMIIALRLTALYSKKSILTTYLNQMYFGNLAYGIQAASLSYFDKSVNNLSLAESAFLIGLISSPDRNNPYVNFEQAKQRQTTVLDLMVKNKFITIDQAALAKSVPIILSRDGYRIKAPHFIDYVRQEIEQTGIKEQKQGINVYTTLDYPDYSLAQDIASNWVNKLRDDHNLSNAALIMLENQTGAIRVMLGGIDYFDATHAGQVNLTTSPRQPGSALKPITYATAFMQGYTPATLIYDVRTVYKTNKGEGFAPNNYDNQFHGLVLAREALASSLNLPAVEMFHRIGIGSFLNTASSLGITTLAPDPKYDLALTLGGGEVTLLDLTNVYSDFSRGGNYLPPYAIEKITYDGGKVLYQHQIPNSKPALGAKSQQIAYLITNILSDPHARILGFGEKNPLVLSFPAAVKTGTTTDWHDNWTVGYTPSYSVGVWVGNNDNNPMTQLTGITGAAPIWHQFFEEFAKGKTVENFVRPPGLKEVEICKADGLLPNNLCTDRLTELFIEGTEPKNISHIYKTVKVDLRNDLLATDSCPPSAVMEKTFLDYPPQVYQWAVENNLVAIPKDYSPLCGQVSTPQSQNSYLAVTSPESKAVYQSAPTLVKNQSLDLKVNASADIIKVDWYVDGVFYQTTTSQPFTVSWSLITGKHVVKAEGKSASGKTIDADAVNMSVVDYP